MFIYLYLGIKRTVFGCYVNFFYYYFSVMNFTLIAKETVPNNAKYSTATLTVFIRDVNDNFPEFSRKIYEVSPFFHTKVVQ